MLEFNRKKTALRRASLTGLDHLQDEQPRSYIGRLRPSLTDSTEASIDHALHIDHTALAGQLHST